MDKNGIWAAITFVAGQSALIGSAAFQAQLTAVFGKSEPIAASIFGFIVTAASTALALRSRINPIASTSNTSKPL